jgi:hypothetical protein
MFHFDFDANSNINPATIHQLATGDWITKGQRTLASKSPIRILTEI